MASIPKPNAAALNESPWSTAVWRTPLNSIHSDMKPLVGGMPIMVKAPIMAITAV